MLFRNSRMCSAVGSYLLPVRVGTRDFKLGETSILPLSPVSTHPLVPSNRLLHEPIPIQLWLRRISFTPFAYLHLMVYRLMRPSPLNSPPSGTYSTGSVYSISAAHWAIATVWEAHSRRPAWKSQNWPRPP